MRVPALGVALAAIASISVPCTAATTSYPSKPVRVLAAGAAAGPIDIMSRVVMQKLSEQLGQPIVIDNRGGAGGTIATRLAAQANPDGYTLLCNSSQYVVAVSLYRQPGYDAFRDFAPIINAGSSPDMIFANPSAGMNNLTELLALSKNTCIAYFAPAGTPKAIVDQLNRQTTAILQLPDTKKRLAVLGFDPVENSPEQFVAYIRVEVAKWAKVIKESGARVD